MTNLDEIHSIYGEYRQSLIDNGPFHCRTIAKGYIHQEKITELRSYEFGYYIEEWGVLDFIRYFAVRVTKNI